MDEAPEPIVPPSPSLPLTPNKILQQPLKRPGRARKSLVTSQPSAVPSVGRGCPIPASLVPVTLREACTHDEGKATLTSIDIPARRPRELPGHAAALDEPPAQRAKVGQCDDAEPAPEARRVPAEGASDDGSTAGAAGTAGDQGTTRRAPARLIATRTVHIPKACWSAATDPGIEMEFWQLGGAGPAAYMPARVQIESLLGGDDDGQGAALTPCPRPLLFVTPVAPLPGQDKTDNAQVFMSFVRFLAHSHLLAQARLRAFDVPVLGPHGTTWRRQDEILVLCPPDSSALQGVLLHSSFHEVTRQDYLMACFVQGAGA